LPVWLCLNKKIKKAYALDISQNCVKKIRENIKKYNITQDIIIPVLSDGLECFGSDSGSDFDFSELTDIIIAGMGGENIAEIITKAPVIKNKQINFILQPNSKIHFLKKFLRENKFDIIQEISVESKKRRYIIINAKLSTIQGF